jgi:hypothetical protein
MEIYFKCKLKCLSFFLFEKCLITMNESESFEPFFYKNVEVNYKSRWIEQKKCALYLYETNFLKNHVE